MHKGNAIILLLAAPAPPATLCIRPSTEAVTDGEPGTFRVCFYTIKKRSFRIRFVSRADPS